MSCDSDVPCSRCASCRLCQQTTCCLGTCAYARPQPVRWTAMLVPKSNCVKRSNKRCQKEPNRQILYRQSCVGDRALAQSRSARGEFHLLFAHWMVEPPSCEVAPTV